MRAICEVCAADPTAHSLRKLSEYKGIIRYYTNPTKATQYTDTEGILRHYDNELSTIGNRPWFWIFDSGGFDWKHALQIKTGIGIAKLITSKYATTLQGIQIINPSWYINAMLCAVWPFLSEELRLKITIKGDRYYSVVEFV
jgi:hypothetical protein